MLLDLGDQPRGRSHRPDQVTDRPQVLRRADEGDGDPVHALLDSEARVFQVSLADTLDIEGQAQAADALAAREEAAIHDLAEPVTAAALQRLQRD